MKMYEYAKFGTMLELRNGKRAVYVRQVGATGYCHWVMIENEGTQSVTDEGKVDYLVDESPYDVVKGYKKPEWHDLAKNPSDLPPIEGFRSDFVLVKLINSALPLSVDRRSLDGSWFYNFSDKVVAWREIEEEGGAQ